MKKLISAIAIAVLFQSCTVAKFGGHSAVPIMLNQPNEQMTLIEHVKIRKHRAFNFTAYYDVSSILRKRIESMHPDAVINTTMTIKYNIPNAFLNLWTLGIANSKMIIVEADFMRKK